MYIETTNSRNNDKSGSADSKRSLRAESAKDLIKEEKSMSKKSIVIKKSNISQKIQLSERFNNNYTRDSSDQIITKIFDSNELKKSKSEQFKGYQKGIKPKISESNLNELNINSHFLNIKNIINKQLQAELEVENEEKKIKYNKNNEDSNHSSHLLLTKTKNSLFRAPSSENMMRKRHSFLDKSQRDIKRRVTREIEKSSLPRMFEVPKGPRIIKKINTVYDSFSEEEYVSDDENKYKLKDLLISEKSHFIKLWDLIVVLFVLLSVLFVPFNLAFQGDFEFFNNFEVVVDFVFILDLCLNFFIPYYIGERLVSNQKKIVLNYLTGWFFFDLLASAPTSVIINIFVNKNDDMVLKILKWFKILRFARITKNDSKGQLIADIKINNDSAINRVLKFGFFFVVLIHICTCAWIFVAVNEYDPQNWIRRQNIYPREHYQVYIASLYFNLVSIFSIGYGDITPYPISERLYVSVFLFFGTLVFSFAISSLSNIFSKIDAHAYKLKCKLDVLYNINREYSLNESLYKRVRKAIEFQHHKIHTEKYELLDTLPYVLRKLLIINIYEDGLNYLNIFWDQDTDFIITVVPLLKSLQVVQKDILISVGDFVDEMNLVKKGTLSIKLNDIYNNIEVARVPEDGSFGEIQMYLNERSHYYVTCKTEICDLLILKKDDFTKIKTHFNENITGFLRYSSSFLESVEKSREVVQHLFTHGLNLKDIKLKLNKFNNFLLQQNFEKYYSYELPFDDVCDFVFSHDINDIIKFFNSSMSNNDFFDCFIKFESFKYSKISTVSSTLETEETKPVETNVKSFNKNLKGLKSIQEEYKEIDSSYCENSILMVKDYYKTINMMSKSSDREKKNRNSMRKQSLPPRKSQQNIFDPTGDSINKQRTSNPFSNTETQKHELDYDFKSKIFPPAKIHKNENDVIELSKKFSISKTNSYINSNFNSNFHNNEIVSQIEHYDPIEQQTKVEVLEKNNSQGKYIFNIYNYENNFNPNYFVSRNNSRNPLLVVQRPVEVTYTGSIDKIFNSKKLEISSNNSLEILADVKGFKKLKSLETPGFRGGSLIKKRNAFSSNKLFADITPVLAIMNTNKNSIKDSPFPQNKTIIKENSLKRNQTIDINIFSSPIKLQRASTKFYSNIGSNTVIEPVKIINNTKISVLNLNNKELIKETVENKTVEIKPKTNHNNNNVFKFDKQDFAAGQRYQNKDSIFKKVHTGLQLDELFLLDKNFLMQKMKLFIDEEEEFNKYAKQGLKRLDKMINLLKNGK